ncbi:MAG: response regulator [Clostridia bacterium]|nr:response regulator [Clostridia bacterium]
MAGIFVNVDKEEKLLRYTQQVDAQRQELSAKNKIMDLLIQGTVKLVDRYAACDFEEDIYHFYSQSLEDSVYAPTGAYHDFVIVMASRFKTVSTDLTLEQAFSPENIRENLKKTDDIYRFEYCSKDEKQFKSVAITPLSWSEKEKGKVRAVLLMSQDITEEKMVEIQSRKALREAYEAAERASKAKTEFLSNMSHDIRTPMNAIVGMTAIAGANIENQDRVVDCLGKITQSSRHLLSLINEVLDMSRIESGKIALVEEEFNLSDLCDNLVSLTKAQTDLHHHEFNIRINRIEHEDVCGDSMRIQQLVTNILSNAVKYTPDGGRIEFTIRELPTNSTGLGCYEFVVQDNGIGMTEEFQKVMFEPFTRADDKRTSKIQGTGLGMAIARNFARMMNGDIKVESAPGKGSKFTITIFLKQQNKEIKAIDELINLPVLVVDDDRDCCENTVALLNEIGIDGEWVTSGAEAVARTTERYERDDNYFAVIIDWKMPGMDGIETTRQIRKKVGNDVTIIILSAYDYAEIEQEAREAGVDEFIAKPLFRSRLTATLKNIIQGKPSAAARHYLEDISNCDYTGKRVLLVEDNDLNREIAQEIIGMTGAIVETAENGKDAVGMMTAANEGYYDLVFMDIQMPVMNGYEATAAIRSLHRPDGKEIPIVVMTANAFAEDILLAKNAGMNEHIAKPLDMTRLRDVMRRWLQ